MKTKFITLVVLLIVTVTANAQWKVAPKVGMNLSTVSNTEGSYSKIGYKAGVSVGYGINEMVGVESGLYFSRKGVNNISGKIKTDVDAKPNIKPTDLSLNYLELPLLATFSFDVMENVRLKLSAGAYVAYGVGGSYNRHFQNQKDSQKINPFKDTESNQSGILIKQKGISPFDCGLSFGAGVEINRVTLGVSYDLGLVDMNYFPVDYNKKQQNRSLLFTIAYRF